VASLASSLHPALIVSLYKVPFPWDRHLGGICPPFCLRSYRGEGFLVADWLDLVVALVTPVLRLCRSCRGQPTFGETAVGGLLSSSPGSGLPRWNRQPAVGTAGPLGGAGLLVFEPWRLLGRQPANSSARGMPHKSSPRHYVNLPHSLSFYTFIKTFIHRSGFPLLRMSARLTREGKTDLWGAARYFFFVGGDYSLLKTCEHTYIIYFLILIL
jgi:hypothetical protein